MTSSNNIATQCLRPHAPTGATRIDDDDDDSAYDLMSLSERKFKWNGLTIGEKRILYAVYNL